MKRHFCLLALPLLLAAGTASAQEPPPPAASAPAARVGFQMALRTGYMLPLGTVHGDAPTPGFGPADIGMSESFSGQVPIFVEIGGKVGPAVFVGGYFGLAFGGPGSLYDLACRQGGTTCVAVGVRFGAEVQYHILPAQLANPWIGYGIGFESIALGESRNGQSTTSSLSGFELAHLMGGIDFRLSRVFGLGPYVDFSVGQYARSHVELSGGFSRDADVQNTRTHEWLALGVRGTFFP